MERIILTLTENHPGWLAKKKTADNVDVQTMERGGPCFLVELHEFGAVVKFEEGEKGAILFPWGVIGDIEYPGGFTEGGKKPGK